MITEEDTINAMEIVAILEKQLHTSENKID